MLARTTRKSTQKDEGALAEFPMGRRRRCRDQLREIAGGGEGRLVDAMAHNCRPGKLHEDKLRRRLVCVAEGTKEVAAES